VAVNPDTIPWSVLATIDVSKIGEAVGSGLLIFTLFMTLGSPLVYRGWQTRQTYQALADLPSGFPSTPGDSELVKVSGKIKDTDEKVVSPIQSTRCELAFWKVATLRRYDIFNHMSYWSVEGIGIDAETLVITGDTRDIRISTVGRELIPSGTEKLNQLLGSTENSILDSIVTELDPPGFEDRRTPSEGWPRTYDELGTRIDAKTEPADSPGLLGRVLNAIRTPEGTVQFQETTLSAGETVTVVGRVRSVRDRRVRLCGTESIDPVVTRRSPSELEQKHRRAYRIQLYAIPLFVTALSSLIGYLVFL
jgi:hypothetical protein